MMINRCASAMPASTARFRSPPGSSLRRSVRPDQHACSALSTVLPVQTPEQALVSIAVADADARSPKTPTPTKKPIKMKMKALTPIRFADSVEVMQTHAKGDYDRAACTKSSLADIPADEKFALGGLHIRRLLNAHGKREVAEQEDIAANYSPSTDLHELQMMRRRRQLSIAEIAIGDVVRQGFRGV